jgi:hypothetical protein
MVVNYRQQTPSRGRGFDRRVGGVGVAAVGHGDGIGMGRGRTQMNLGSRYHLLEPKHM